MRPASGEAARGVAFPDDLAMAVPRINPPAGSNGIGLPQPLAPSEAARIRRIFALQRHGLIPAAVAETGRLTDTTLLGHILADRILAKPARASAPALSDWLGRYADLPDSCAIYSLLLAKLPPRAAHPPAPAAATLVPTLAPTLAPALAPALARSARGAMPGSLSMDAARARDAFVRGRDEAALRLGRGAFQLSRGADGQAGFVAGLAAWRLGRIAQSQPLFEGASLAQDAGAGLRAGAAFWAARGHAESGDAAGWRAWMLRAAAEPHTLHGRLARVALGLERAAVPASPVLAQADVDAVAATPQGHRALALLQVGENARAEAELRGLWPATQTSPPLGRALYLVAGAAGLSDLVADLSSRVDATEADLPVPVLRPRGGYKLRAALVYAVAHVESNFDTQAVSGAGAKGLMQLMPETAGPLVHEASFRTLADPGQNLRVGQAYLATLARPDMAGDDLLRVLASYNAGPGAVQRWANHERDPLLFLETIPVEETRHFVQRTLTNLWAYAARFRQPSPSLDAMAVGAWPRFSPEVIAQPASRRGGTKPAAEPAVVRLH